MENHSLLARFHVNMPATLYIIVRPERDSVSWEYQRSGAVSTHGARVPRTMKRNAKSYKCEVIRIIHIGVIDLGERSDRTQTLRPIPTVSRTFRPWSDTRKLY